MKQFNGYKKCSHCDCIFPVIMFHKQKEKVDGLSTQCMECIHNRYQVNRNQILKKAHEYGQTHKKQIYEYQKNYAKYHRKQINGYQKKSRINTKLLVFSIYTQNKMYCKLCGFDNLDALTVDHINHTGAEHRKCVGDGISFYYWLIKNNFPEGYRILCRNCNWLEHLRWNDNYFTTLGLEK